jgi:hypothetical protein
MNHVLLNNKQQHSNVVAYTYGSTLPMWSAIVNFSDRGAERFKGFLKKLM